MKFYKALFLLLCFSFICRAQEGETAKTLNEQFGDLKEKSQTFNQYKVIVETRLDDWFQTIQDSLSVQRKDIFDLQSSTRLLEDTITQLRAEKESMQSNLDQSDFEKTHIGVFGINFSKGTFILIALSAITALIIVIAFLMIKIIDSNRTRRESVKLKDALSAEFEEFKRRALDKQTKLARDLQTERNKLEEIKRKR